MSASSPRHGMQSTPADSIPQQARASEEITVSTLSPGDNLTNLVNSIHNPIHNPIRNSIHNVYPHVPVV
eukprot:scaffold111826_cov58-Phaeocystis_antarctica.AAC.5